MATLETSDKAKLDQSKIQYAVLKTTYEIKIKDAETSA
jgi:hypothetical protein